SPRCTAPGVRYQLSVRCSLRACFACSFSRPASTCIIGVPGAPGSRPGFFGALTWATLPSASGLGRRRRGFPLLRVLASWTLITFGTLHAKAAGVHFYHCLPYHKYQMPFH